MAIALLLAGSAVAQPAERRVALVIGNGQYQHVPRLTNPTSDARLIAETLRSVGFTLVGGKAQFDLDKTAFDRMVQEFIRRLNVRERDTAFYRLPTEAQWEYAARAGSITSFSFGRSLRQLRRHAWYKANAGGTTHPVGQLQPNAWGLYDMHGNVNEWVQDWIGDYASGTVLDPEGPASGDKRITRGCGWNAGVRDCWSSSRWFTPPSWNVGGFIGFRLLRVAQ